MCCPLIFIVLQVLLLQYGTSYPSKYYIIAYIPVEELAYLLPQNIEAIPIPYYSSGYYFDPWYYQSMMMPNVRSPFRQTTGGTFGGQVKAKGPVKIMGNFGNQGYGTVTSYSAPPTPLIVKPEPVLLTSPPAPSTAPPSPLIVTPEPVLPTSNLSTAASLPNITTLPEVSSIPTTTITQTFEDPPSTVSVTDTPMPFITVTTTVPTDDVLNGNVASPIKFSGKVPASGRVRISAHFC